MVTVLSWLYTIMLSKRKKRKLAGKNVKVIMPKEIKVSSVIDIEIAIDSVNNANCSIVENEVLDEN